MDPWLLTSRWCWRHFFPLSDEWFVPLKMLHVEPTSLKYKPVQQRQKWQNSIAENQRISFIMSVCLVQLHIWLEDSRLLYSHFLCSDVVITYFHAIICSGHEVCLEGQKLANCLQWGEGQHLHFLQSISSWMTRKTFLPLPTSSYFHITCFLLKVRIQICGLNLSEFWSGIEAGSFRRARLLGYSPSMPHCYYYNSFLQCFCSWPALIGEMNKKI